jgi:hypothetical protein
MEPFPMMLEQNRIIQLLGRDETSIVELFETHVIPSCPGNAVLFSDSQRTELDGLLEAGVFRLERHQDALDRVTA